MKPKYALRYESDKGGWTQDSEIGQRQSVALDELKSLVTNLERRFENGELEWAYVTLIMEPGEWSHSLVYYPDPGLWICTVCGASDCMELPLAREECPR